MKTKKVPLRMCVVTRNMLPKRELIRVVKQEDGNVVIDRTGKLSGRGAYITNDLEVIKKCIKTKALNRAFEMQISNEVYNKLLEDFLAKQ